VCATQAERIDNLLYTNTDTQTVKGKTVCKKHFSPGETSIDHSGQESHFMPDKRVVFYSTSQFNQLRKILHRIIKKIIKENSCLTASPTPTYSAAGEAV